MKALVIGCILALPAVPQESPKKPGVADKGAGPARASGVLISCDFEEENWWKAWGLQSPPKNTSPVEGKEALGGKGKSLKGVIPAGSTMGPNFGFKFQKQIGREPEEIYFRYYLKFDPDWKNAIDGGKLPGISGTYGKAGWGGRKVDGTDGWSARGHFSAAGPDTTNIGFYCYHADMKGDYGDVWKFQPPLKNGEWYCIELYCKLNSIGKKEKRGMNDGILRGWINGHVAFEKSDIRFRDVDSLKIEEVWVDVYHGGMRPTPGDMHLTLDDLVIATKSIGPRKSGTQSGK